MQFAYLVFLTIITGCGIENHLTKKKYEVCEPDDRFRLSSAWIDGRCNARRGQCPVGFNKTKSNSRVNGENCVEIICGNPGPGERSSCKRRILQ